MNSFFASADRPLLILAFIQREENKFYALCSGAGEMLMSATKNMKK